MIERCKAKYPGKHHNTLSYIQILCIINIYLIYYAPEYVRARRCLRHKFELHIQEVSYQFSSKVHSHLLKYFFHSSIRVSKCFVVLVYLKLLFIRATLFLNMGSMHINSGLPLFQCVICATKHQGVHTALWGISQHAYTVLSFSQKGLQNIVTCFIISFRLVCFYI